MATRSSPRRCSTESSINAVVIQIEGPSYRLRQHAPTSFRSASAPERRSPHQPRSRHGIAADRRKTGAWINTPADHRHPANQGFFVRHFSGTFSRR